MLESGRKGGAGIYFCKVYGQYREEGGSKRGSWIVKRRVVPYRGGIPPYRSGLYRIEGKLYRITVELYRITNYDVIRHFFGVSPPRNPH
jgi:hypothetical protein